MVLAFDEAEGRRLIDRACELRPLLAATTAQSEADGKLVPEVVAAITDAGFLKLAVPRRWDGLAASCNTIANLTAELAKSCPSTAWLTSVMNTAVWRHTLLSDASQEDMFSSSVPLFCGVGVPQMAKPVEGGFVIEKGSWSYASGCHHADFFHGTILIEGGGPPRLAIIPVDELDIVRTWDVTGMRGTGSDTVVATNIFVPQGRAPLSEPQFEASPTRTRHVGEVTDYWTVMPYIRTKILGTLLGTVEGVLDHVIASVDRPIVYTEFKRKGDSHVFDAQVGRAGAKAYAVRSVMNMMTTEIDRAALAMKPMRRAERARSRGQLAFCVDQLTDAMTILANAAGSSMFLKEKGVERLWRDFNVASRHAMLGPDVGYEIAGRSILGEPDIAKPEFV